MKKLLAIVIPLILVPSGNLAAQEVLAIENATVQPPGIRQGENGLMFFNIQGGGGEFRRQKSGRQRVLRHDALFAPRQQGGGQDRDRHAAPACG